MTTNQQVIALILTLVAVVVVGVYGQSGQLSTSSQVGSSIEHAYLRFDDRCVELETAVTSAEKRRGLSSREQLPDDQGMLFVYEKAGKHSFWMKDMNFPIDIIWLNDQDQVVTVKRSVQPNSFPQTFEPTESAKNVIETVAGFAESENINSSDRLNIIGPTTTTPVGC